MQVKFFERTQLVTFLIENSDISHLLHDCTHIPTIQSSI